MMKKSLVVAAAVAFLMAVAVTAARADLIAVNPNQGGDLTAFGFGTVNPVLTLQANPLEKGCVVPGPSVSCASPPAPAAWNTSAFTPITGSVSPPGPPKYTSPTLGSLGLTDYAHLGILFNVVEPESKQQVTLQALSLGIFNGSTFVGKFDLAGPVDFTNISPGQGRAGFVIGIASNELNSVPFNPDFTIGMAAEIGCTLADTTKCNVPGQFSTAGGAESFTAVKLAAPIPEPATLLLLGSGLVGLGLRRFRK